MSGHVFVVNGRIQHVVHNLAIVPTDSFLTVEEHWNAVYPLRRADPAVSSWAAEHFGQSQSCPTVWFLNVGGRVLGEVTPHEVAHRFKSLLFAMVTPMPLPVNGRVKPLIAVPVLGVGEGGNNAKRGDTIRALLEAANEAVTARDVDIAIVTPGKSVFGAVQRHRSSTPGLNTPVSEHTTRLAQLAADSRLSLFIGAGASVPSGLPSWADLIAKLSADADADFRAHVEALHSPLDQAELLSQRYNDSLGRRVIDALSPDALPSLAHALLAGLECRAALTTNYDDLYEQAVAATGRPRPTAIPTNITGDGGQWILKMHGSREQGDSIVLTRSDFVHFDARVKPAASVLQSVALTSHLLIVGASLNDDNVVRLLLEVAKFRSNAGVQGPFATLLGVKDEPARKHLWQGKVEWLTMGSGQLPESARNLEVFLDDVARQACRDSSWLLDERFAGLLEPEAAAPLAGELRRIAARVAVLAQGSEPNAWRDLDRALRSFGARPNRRGGDG